MNSNKFLLNLWDLSRGMIMAVLSGSLMLVYQALQANAVIDWRLVGLAGITAGLGYLIKNYFSDSQGIPFGNADKRHGV